MTDLGIDKQRFARLLELYKVKKIAVFGSFAKGTAGQTSDIDFLVEFEKGADLLDQVGLKLDLEELLARKVDVVTPNSLSRHIRDRVLEEAVYL